MEVECPVLKPNCKLVETSKTVITVKYICIEKFANDRTQSDASIICGIRIVQVLALWNRQYGSDR
jgi:hypothetical protein